MLRSLLLAAAVLPPCALLTAASAQTVVPTSAFNTIELEGGGHVVLKHGAVQRVTILKGSTEFTHIYAETFQPRKLKIEACNNRCPEHYDLEIEIVSPEVPAVAVEGGGSIETADGFPGQGSLTAAIQGGGRIRLANIHASDVTAAVDGGGHIEVRAEKNLTAAINGGGHITYWGNPNLTQAVNGGGSVSQGT